MPSPPVTPGRSVPPFEVPATPVLSPVTEGRGPRPSPASPLTLPRRLNRNSSRGSQPGTTAIACASCLSAGSQRTPVCRGRHQGVGLCGKEWPRWLEANWWPPGGGGLTPASAAVSTPRLEVAGSVAVARVGLSPGELGSLPPTVLPDLDPGGLGLNPVGAGGGGPVLTSRQRRRRADALRQRVRKGSAPVGVSPRSNS